MEKLVQVTIKNVYGEERIYPANEAAILFAQMVKQKSLTRHDIDFIKRLGFVVEVVQPRVEL